MPADGAISGYGRLTTRNGLRDFLLAWHRFASSRILKTALWACRTDAYDSEEFESLCRRVERLLAVLATGAASLET